VEPPFARLVTARFVDDPCCRWVGFQIRKVLPRNPGKRFVSPGARLLFPPARFTAAGLDPKAPVKLDAERGCALVQANALGKPPVIAGVTTPGSETAQTRYRLGGFQWRGRPRHGAGRYLSAER
jgi:hypothetical protein